MNLGRYKAVAKVFRFQLRGFPAWWLARTYHVSQIPGFARKVRAVMDWTVGLPFQRDIAEVGTIGQPRPLRADAYERAGTHRSLADGGYFDRALERAGLRAALGSAGRGARRAVARDGRPAACLGARARAVRGAVPSGSSACASTFSMRSTQMNSMSLQQVLRGCPRRPARSAWARSRARCRRPGRRAPSP